MAEHGDYKPPADTRWIDIQKRTFTRWANNFLTERMMKIEDLGTNLSDGLLLVNLLEVISSKPIPAYNKKPKIRAQKLENTGACLQFLKNEGIKLVAIGPEDITDCNLKLILGLIWTIILRYQIQRISGAGGSAKNDLLQWVRSKIPECNVNDFTNSWSDGRSICHLCEALKPGVFPGNSLDQLKGKNPLDNATKGEDVAESELGIPKILEPADMVEALDELSTMTYISYFRDYDLGEGKRRAAELAAKTADPTKTKAWGPGLEGAETYTPTEFYIQAVNAAGVNVPVGGEKFKVTINGPSGNQEVPVTDNGDGTYKVQYTCNDAGPHTINVELKTQRGAGPWAPIQNSPWTVNVVPTADPASTIIESFTVVVRAKNKRGQNMTRGGEKFAMTLDGQALNLRDNGDGTYTATWEPARSGSHQYRVTINGKDISGSPWAENH